MPADLALRSSRVVTPDGVAPATVLAQDGVIVALTGWGDAPPDVVDVGDAAIMPGLVDTHVHVNEPGRTHWEGFATATRAAAAGGVTTLVDMPLNSLPPTTTVAALEAKRASARDQAHVDVGFWGGAVPGNAGDIPGLHDAGVLGFKAFLCDSGVEEFSPLPAAGVEDVLARVAALGALLAVHAEDPAHLAPAAPAGDRRAYATWLRTRPAAAEEAAVAALLDGAGRHGARVHVLHASAAAVVEAVGAARAAGVAATVETCPHYLALAAEGVADGATTHKCAPPIRERANRERLWEAVGAGLVDAVVSDHSPCPPDAKRLDDGDFLAAWGGIASLELGLRVVWTEAAARGIDLAAVARLMATGPARLVGLRRKGALAPGLDADIVVLDPDATATVDAAALEQRHPITPYAGARLRGSVRATYLRGRCVARDGHPVGAPAGRLLERGGA